MEIRPILSALMRSKVSMILIGVQVALTLAIGVDNIAGGFSGTCLIAYMSSLTSIGYTATQYALFASLMLLPGKFLGGWSGAIVDWAEANSRKLPLIGDLLVTLSVTPKHEGYVVFFIYTTLVGLPAVILSIWLARRTPPPPSVSKIFE